MLATGVLHHLIGLENNEKDGTGPCWNFILSNGQRSTQRDEDWPTNYTFKMSEGAEKMIKQVKIYDYDGMITGFMFLDKDNNKIWKIGKI